MCTQPFLLDHRGRNQGMVGGGYPPPPPVTASDLRPLVVTLVTPPVASWPRRCLCRGREEIINPNPGFGPKLLASYCFHRSSPGCASVGLRRGSPRAWLPVLERWQGRHNSCRLSNLSPPPLLAGTIWSTSDPSPPQSWHIPLSRRKMAALRAGQSGGRGRERRLMPRSVARGGPSRRNRGRSGTSRNRPAHRPPDRPSPRRAGPPGL